MTPGPAAQAVRDGLDHSPSLADVVAELAELTRRQMNLLQTLAAAGAVPALPTGCGAAA